MPDPKFTKPWHGISPDKIKWNPTVLQIRVLTVATV